MTQSDCGEDSCPACRSRRLRDVKNPAQEELFSERLMQLLNEGEVHSEVHPEVVDDEVMPKASEKDDYFKGADE